MCSNYWHSLAVVTLLTTAGFLVTPTTASPEQKPEGQDWASHPLNRWVRQSPRPGKAAPPFGWEGSGAYDPHSRKWIHQGGHDGIPQGFHLFTFDLESGAWEQRFPNTSPPGACCVDGGNVFDVANRRFVRFPGASLGHGYQWSRGVKLKSSHAWVYDVAANTWTNMRPPPYHFFQPREGLGSLNPAATYDPVHELALSFGGQGSSGGTNNLFAYDVYANRLHRLTAANPPSPRDGMGLAYDAGANALVMFGSQYADDEKTWIYRYETGKWQGHALDPHPPGKKLGTYSTIPKMAYDPLHGVVLCLTWDTKTNQHESWALDTGKLQWKKLNPAAEPSPSMSRSRNLSFSAEHNLFILETSSKDGKGKAPEIWTYRFDKAPENPTIALPTDLQVVTAPGAANLTWKAGASEVLEYQVWRAQAEKPWETKFAKIATTPGTAFLDKGLENGKVTFYQVRAVAKNGAVSQPSFQARTQPRVQLKPVVSVLNPEKVEVRWDKHPAPDVTGYNVYRAIAAVRTVKKGTPSPWKDNDPEYAEPVPVEVRDLLNLKKLNDTPLTEPVFVDAKVTLKKDANPEEAKYNVYAYLVTAVNKLGTESGPSPYALTISSEPQFVFCKERGDTADLKWAACPEKGIAGYHVYKLGKGVFEIVRITPEPIKGTTFSHQGGRNSTRYWVLAVDSLGQEGEPSSPVWFNQSYKGFYQGEWHQ